MPQVDDVGSSAVSHVFLTRFNLPTRGPESLVRAQDGWLRNRWDLFCRYTVPSMRAQTRQDYDWLIYFDVDSPEWLLNGISGHAAEGLYVPLFRTEVGPGDVISDIADAVAVRGERLLTTNLDNDDGLAFDFVERLQAIDSAAPRSAIYLINGVIRSGDSLYRRTDRDNAFCSVLEGWQDPVTCWHDWHILLGQHMPVREVAGPPAWLQVVHGTNVSNRVHGRLISASDVVDQFGPLIADVSAPSRIRMMADRLLFGPARILRDRLRAVGKTALMAVGGKRGLDRVKELSGRIRRGTTSV